MIGASDNGCLITPRELRLTYFSSIFLDTPVHADHYNALPKSNWIRQLAEDQLTKNGNLESNSSTNLVHGCFDYNATDKMPRSGCAFCNKL